MAQDQAMMLAHWAGKPADCASAELLSWPDSKAKVAFLQSNTSPASLSDLGASCLSRLNTLPLDSLHHRAETSHVFLEPCLSSESRITWMQMDITDLRWVLQQSCLRKFTKLSWTPEHTHIHTHTCCRPLGLMGVGNVALFLPFLSSFNCFLVMSKSTALLCHHFSVEDLAHLDSAIFVEACKATENVHDWQEFSGVPKLPLSDP